LKKLWLFVRKNFLTKKFLIFCLVGVINTAIHMSVYYAFYNKVLIPVLSTGWSSFISNTIAFVSASIFSYFANAFFTFKPKNKTAMQFTAVMTVFLARLLISDLLTTGFDFIIQDWIGLSYDQNSLYSIIAPFLASALLIPIAYFALDYVFHKTDRKKTTN